MRIEKNIILNNINELKSLNSQRLAKYYRNYRRYNYTPYASIENIRSPSVVGYYQEDMGIEDDTLPTPQVNVIKSCIDTLTSKIAQSKVRPFFNAVGGSFKDIQIIKQAQQFFDIFFELQNVNKTVSLAFKDGCIFDNGVIFVNPFTQRISKVLPYQYFVRPSEATYNKITRCYYEQKQYPVTLLDFELKELKDYEYITYGLYFDTKNKICAEYIQDINYIKIHDYNASVVPFVQLYYCEPVFGNTSQSVVDMLNSIQLQIDNLVAKISEASQLNPASTIFVPKGSDIKASALNNRIGNVLFYNATPNMTGSPVTVSNPPFIDGQYLQLFNEYKATAYEMVGISQLSAQSQKPSGLNAGVALQTMENIESDRFETQLNQIIRAYTDIAKICIEVFPQDKPILPEMQTRTKLKWADVVKQKNNMSIQFSGADALSKDPSTKLQQLQMLAQSGVIPSQRIAQLMEVPDLEGGYSVVNNSINAVMKVISNCIENDKFDIPDFIPFELLKEEIVNTQLSLSAIGGEQNEKDIQKLTKLFEILSDRETEWANEVNAQVQAQGGSQEPLPDVAQNDMQSMAQYNNGVDLDMNTAQPTEKGGWNK